MKLKIVIPVIIGAALVFVGVNLIKKKKEEEAKLQGAKIYPLVVKTITPKTEETNLTLPYIATVKSSKEVTLSSKFSGRILYIKNLGEKVKKNETLIKIDNSDLLSKLKEVKENINSLKAKLQAQKISLNNLLKTFERTKKLLEVKMASIEDYQNQESKIAELKASIKATKASLKTLETNKNSILNSLTYTTIKSPINGVISAKMANKGDLALSGRAILKVSSTKGNYLLVTLPSKKEGIIFENKFYKLIPLNTTIDGVKAFKADVNKSLIPGERVKIDVVEFKGKATILPYNAILSINSKNYVFIPSKSHATVKEVHILAQGKNEVAIKENLSSPVIKAEPDILLKIKAGYPIKVKKD